MIRQRVASLGLVGAAIDLFGRSLQCFIRLEGFDRAMALAGQSFAALLPLLIVIGTVSPASGKDAAAEIVDRLDLTGASAQAITDAVAQPAAIEDGISALSIFILVLSALAFTRALQRLYTRAWGLEKIGLRGNGWGLIWLAAFSGYWSAQPVIVSLFDGAAAVTVSLVLGCALWLFTPWVLVGRQIPWRRLLPQAILTSVGLTLLGVTSVVYMPRAVASTAAQFGFIGVAFALLSWLFFVSMVLVVTAAVGSTLVERKPVVRGGSA